MKSTQRRTSARIVAFALMMALAAPAVFVLAANADAPAASPTENWVNVSAAFTKQIGAEVLNPEYLERCQGLIVTPTGDLVMLTAQKGICISKDEGATWSVVANNGIAGRCEGGASSSMPYPYDGRMAFFAYDGAAGMSGGMSLDGGKTWSPFSQLARGLTYGDADWNAPDPQTIFGLTHEPFFSVLSDDGGENWQRLDPKETGSGVEANYCLGMIDAKTFVRYNPGKQGGIIELSSDAGQTWTQVAAYQVLGRRVVHYGPHLYWTTTQGVIMTTNGKDWTLTGKGAEGAIWGPFFGSSEQEFVVVTNNDFLKTEDGGKTWKPIAKFHSAPDIFHGAVPYSFFGWDAKHNILYVSGLGAAVYQLKLDASESKADAWANVPKVISLAVAAPTTGPSIGVELDPKSPDAKLLEELSLLPTALPIVMRQDVLSALSEGHDAVVVTDATPATLKTLASHPEVLQAFTAKGGWLMLWGLAPDGLTDFNRLVGVEHLLRPFTVEAVGLPTNLDPLLAGINANSLNMFAGQGMAGIPLRDGDAWSYVLDGDDIAPFAKIPPSDYWRPGAVTAPGSDQYPPNLVNGMDDSWQLGFTIPATKPEYLKWNFDFPRSETVTQFSLTPDTTYNKIQRIRLTFPGSTTQPLEFAVQPSITRQDFPVPNIQATGVTLEIITAPGTAAAPAVTGIRNVWIKVQRSDEFNQKVHPLLSIGVLNKYPMGKGGILLNEMQPKESQTFDTHRKQKRILSILLHNLLDKPQ